MKGKERNHFSLSISFNPQVPRRWEEGPGGWGSFNKRFQFVTINFFVFFRTDKKKESE